MDTKYEYETGELNIIIVKIRIYDKSKNKICYNTADTRIYIILIIVNFISNSKCCFTKQGILGKNIVIISQGRFYHLDRHNFLVT